MIKLLRFENSESFAISNNEKLMRFGGLAWWGPFEILCEAIKSCEITPSLKYDNMYGTKVIGTYKSIEDFKLSRVEYFI